jgi:hypothetical protein
MIKTIEELFSKFNKIRPKKYKRKVVGHTYLFQGIPYKLWHLFTDKCKEDDESYKSVLISLMNNYIEEDVSYKIFQNDKIDSR